MRRLVTVLLALALVASACTSGGSTIVATVASSPAGIGTGIQRILFALVNQDTGELVSSPNLDPFVTLRDENGAPLDSVEAKFLWTIPNVRGIYSVYFDLPEPATYQLTISLGGSEIGPIGVVALDDPAVVGRGELAPLTETRTTSEHELSAISSDPSPEPSFYELSVHQAVQSGPSVIIFATPAWCTSQACGPLLEQVKELAPSFPGLNFVHVEVYENIQAEAFEDLVVVDAVMDWGLPSEPWIFVTNADGVVTASFEGAASGEELIAAFGAVSP